MTKPEILFLDIIQQIPNAIKGKAFGALCIKVHNGKIAAIFWKERILLKLPLIDLNISLKLKESKTATHLYSTDKPMKGWVSIPYRHSEQWIKYAKKAVEYVGN